MKIVKSFCALLLVASLFALSSCAEDKIKADTEGANILAYDFIFFDSDGDGIKEDIAELRCVGMSGGYGSFRLFVYVLRENEYVRIFDSKDYTIDYTDYENLSSEIGIELMIDSFYSVKAADVDFDDCEELICLQYAWADCHSNHIGDIVSVFKLGRDALERTYISICNKNPAVSKEITAGNCFSQSSPYIRFCGGYPGKSGGAGR